MQLSRDPTSKQAERVKAILASKDRSLHQVSQQSERLYGRSSAYYLPHNLYYELGRAGFTPRIQQVFALSRISGYRLHDWLLAFGFDVTEILRLQVLLPLQRTVLLDPFLDDPSSWLPNFTLKPGAFPASGVLPLSAVIDRAAGERLSSLAPTRHFVRYAKIGWEDAYAFPELIPGSIVRLDTRGSEAEIPALGETSRRLFLVEHARGLCCCRIYRVATNRILLLRTQLPYAEIELLVPEEGRIVGVVDLEIRPLTGRQKTEVPSDLARHWAPARIRQAPVRLSDLLRQARARMGTSLRDASTLSREIAVALGEERYFTASGSLSDYEASDQAPRHIHKIITLCAIYGVGLATLLASVGMAGEQSGGLPIPDELVSRGRPNWTGEHPPGERVKSGYAQLLGAEEDIPFFLRRSIPALSGLSSVSANDLFWTGGECEIRHPCMKDSVLAIVNRRAKAAVHSRSKGLWEQPLYLVQKRDGKYIGACCSLENNTLILHSYSHSFSHSYSHSPSHPYRQPERFRNHVDAELVGQLVTVIRKF